MLFITVAPTYNSNTLSNFNMVNRKQSSLACPECENEVFDHANFCDVCGTQLGAQSTRQSQLNSSPTRFWLLPILLPILNHIYLFAAGFVIGFFEGLGVLTPGDAAVFIEWATYPWLVAFFLTGIAATAGIYMDRKNLHRTFNWQPSLAWYLVIVPGINALVSLAYVYYRWYSLRKLSS